MIIHIKMEPKLYIILALKNSRNYHQCLVSIQYLLNRRHQNLTNKKNPLKSVTYFQAISEQLHNGGVVEKSQLYKSYGSEKTKKWALQNGVGMGGQVGFTCLKAPHHTEDAFVNWTFHNSNKKSFHAFCWRKP